MTIATEILFEYGRRITGHLEHGEPSPPMRLVCSRYTFADIMAGKDAINLVSQRLDGVWEVANLPVVFEDIEGWRIEADQ